MNDKHAQKQIAAMREASKYLNLDNYRCLILNRDYAPLSYLPISAVGWQDAIVGQLMGKLEVLETYDQKAIRTPSTEFKVPAVAVTKVYSKVRRKVVFSKSNVYLRDDYTCQYCDHEFTGSHLTFDHVIPRCKGGKTSWLNIVSACDDCNRKKSNKSLGEWKPPSGRYGPKKKPYEPTHFELADKAKAKPLIIPEGSKWENYIDWIGPLLVRNPQGGTMQINGPYMEPIGEEALGF